MMELLKRCVKTSGVFFTRCWKRIIVVIILLVALIAGINILAKKVKKNFVEVYKLQQIETQLCMIANQDYTGNQYKSIEGDRYLLELFPYGVTDDERFDPSVGRIIKVTYYNNSRTKVVREEYKIVKKIR